MAIIGHIQLRHPVQAAPSFRASCSVFPCDSDVLPLGWSNFDHLPASAIRDDARDRSEGGQQVIIGDNLWVSPPPNLDRRAAVKEEALSEIVHSYR